MEAEFISPKDCVKYNTCKFADDSGCLDGCDFRLTKGMRRCKGIKYIHNPQTKKYETTEFTGVFHGWGVDYEELENGPGPFTCAIVELDNGEVKLIPAEKLTFINDIKPLASNN